MTPASARTLPFAADGEVVEMFEQAGGCAPRCCSRPAPVLDLPIADATDLHLGDEVAIDATLTLRAVRSKVDAGSPDRGV